MNENNSGPNKRRFFLTQVGAGVTAIAAAGTAAVPTAVAQSAGGAPWQPVRHTQDDWLDQIPGGHRFIFDTTTPQAWSSGLLFANNYYLANSSGYSLKDSDLAVVLVARHFSTPFAYTDAIWAKYGTAISSFIGSTGETAKANTSLRQLEGLLKRGAHVAVCGMATSAIAGSIARSAGVPAAEIVKEINSNLVANAHMVPAGIVVLNRAQERGYAFVTAG
jgi:intracellular sulfur oxidation DsrE/DsrF family protein